MHEVGLGERARELTRHFLLLTATPHNGKETDFQLFLSLIDPDRFEGHQRTAGEQALPTGDTADLMRRLMKENLTRFDGTALFPPRYAHVVQFQLSPAEASLYERVTSYVRDEMNCAERLKQEGRGRQGSVVGFALTVLQRRGARGAESCAGATSDRGKEAARWGDVYGYSWRWRRTSWRVAARDATDHLPAPEHRIAVPTNFVTMTKVMQFTHLIDTQIGLVVLLHGDPRAAQRLPDPGILDALPRELDEAAHMDGCLQASRTKSLSPRPPASLHWHRVPPPWLSPWLSRDDRHHAIAARCPGYLGTIRSLLIEYL